MVPIGGRVADSRSNSTGWVVFAISLATFMSSLDATIVYIALPAMQRYFGAGLRDVSWVAVGDMLPTVSLLMPFGRIGDLYGHRRIFLSGFGLFTLASVFCAFSPGIWTLVGFRVIQAVGGAMMASMSFALLTDCIPADRRGGAFGWLNVSASVAICLGPALGGFLAEYLSWRAIFLINVPVGVFGVTLGLRVLPRGRESSGSGPFDTSGALLLLSAMVSFVMLLHYLPDGGWRSPAALIPLLGVLVLFPGFAYRESRAKRPLLELKLFLRKNFTWSNAGGFLFFVVLNGSYFILPFFLEHCRGLSADRAGLMLTLPSAVMVVSGVFIGRLSDRLDARLLCGAGMSGLLLTFVIFYFFTAYMSMWIVGAAFALLGLSSGLFVIPNSNLIMSLAGNGEQGVVSGLMNTVRRFGSLAGVSLFSVLLSVFAHTPSGGTGAAGAGADGCIHAFREVSIASAAIVLAGLCLTLLLKPDKMPRARA
jgi:EmrB/QacA subfamily drug resistance transporter